MRLLGHGVDVVEVSGFLPADVQEELIFVTRCFRPHEIDAAGKGPHRASRLAARFAAKEAVLKALGTGWGDGMAFLDVEILATATGAPAIALHGRCADVAESIGISCWLLSLSHTATVAVASVIATAD